MSIGQIRSAMKAAIQAVDGVNVYDYEAAAPSLDAVIVRGPGAMDMRQVLGGFHTNYEIAVTILVGVADMEAADNRLEQLVSEDLPVSQSVVAALRADRTFNGACSSSDIIDQAAWGLLEDGSALATSLTVEVYT